MNAAAARTFADELMTLPTPRIGDSEGRQRRTWWAVGDPQAPFDTFAAILERHGLLGSDGRLHPDVGLVSVGDHFDFGKGGDFVATGREGERIVRWLAAHPSDQTVILLGNHDTVRVQEFAFESDESFGRAQRLALEIASGAGDIEAATRRFFAEHPRLPTPGVVSRDFSAFEVRQRTLLQSLLLARRVSLAAAATLPDGDAVLINHAGFTTRERDLLPVTDLSPTVIARRLNDFLDGAVGVVAERWRAGEAAALDLSPLHIPGVSGQEGGGLLYHRAANPDRAGANKPWEVSAPAPRRYSPYGLPLGLTQVCGHCGHRKLREELKPWVDPDALAIELGGLRTLSCDGTVVRYRCGVHPPRRGGATLYLIDGEMNSVPKDSYPLFRLGRVETAR